MRTALPATFICGLVRNAAVPLKQTIDAIKGLEAICENSVVLVVTNDNVDKTGAVLPEWKSSSANYDVLWLDELERTFSERLDRIAAARNLYLQQWLARSEAKRFAIIVVMDFDGPNIHLSANTVLGSVS